MTRPAPDSPHIIDSDHEQVKRVGLAKIVPTLLLQVDHFGLQDQQPAMRLVHLAAAMLVEPFRTDQSKAGRVALKAATGIEPEMQIGAYLDALADNEHTIDQREMNERAIAVLRQFAPSLLDYVTLNEWREQYGVKRAMATYWAQQGRLLGAFRSPDVEGGIWLVRKDAPKPTALRRGPVPRHDETAASRQTKKNEDS